MSDISKKTADIFGYKNCDPYAALPAGARITRSLNDGAAAVSALTAAVDDLVRAARPICELEVIAPVQVTVPAYNTPISRCLAHQIVGVYLESARLCALAKAAGREIAVPTPPRELRDDQRETHGGQYDMYMAAILAAAVRVLLAVITDVGDALGHVFNPIVQDVGIPVVNVEYEAPLVKELQESITRTQLCTARVRDLIRRCAAGDQENHG